MDLFDELRLVVRSLSATGLPYALCGGLAVAVHGHVRATQDIDLLIRPDDLEVVKERLAAVGYLHESSELPFPTATGASVRMFRATKVAGSEHLTVDLMLADSSPLVSALESREHRTLDDLDLPVVSRDALIEMKQSTGRAIDQADVEGLTRGT